MRVNEQFRKATFFLGVENEGDDGQPRMQPVGTGFFVSVPLIEGQELPAFLYAITARHVIDGSRSAGDLYLYLNTSSGDIVKVIAGHDLWHLSNSTDVAAIVINEPILRDSGADFKHIQSKMFADDEVISANVGEGDEVFFPSLFQGFLGRDQIRPIVRFGNISLMPYERIPISMDPGSPNSTKDVDAYLVEAQSWGGESGAPAFVALVPDNLPSQLRPGSDSFKLLGLVHGHFKIQENVNFLGDIAGSGSVGVNSGIAVVIPAQDIFRLLNSGELAEQQTKLAEEFRLQETPSSSKSPDKPK